VAHHRSGRLNNRGCCPGLLHRDGNLGHWQGSLPTWVNKKEKGLPNRRKSASTNNWFRPKYRRIPIFVASEFGFSEVDRMNSKNQNQTSRLDSTRAPENNRSRNRRSASSHSHNSTATRGCYSEAGRLNRAYLGATIF